MRMGSLILYQATYVEVSLSSAHLGQKIQVILGSFHGVSSHPHLSILILIKIDEDTDGTFRMSWTAKPNRPNRQTAQTHWHFCFGSASIGWINLCSYLILLHPILIYYFCLHRAAHQLLISHHVGTAIHRSATNWCVWIICRPNPRQAKVQVPRLS